MTVYGGRMRLFTEPLPGDAETRPSAPAIGRSERLARRRVMAQRLRELTTWMDMLRGQMEEYTATWPEERLWFLGTERSIRELHAAFQTRLSMLAREK